MGSLLPVAVSHALQGHINRFIDDRWYIGLYRLLLPFFLILSFFIGICFTDHPRPLLSLLLFPLSSLLPPLLFLPARPDARFGGATGDEREEP